MSRCPCTTRWPSLRYRLRAPGSVTWSASTERSASFACSSSGSLSSRPVSSSTQLRVPTLPTPTTLRAMSTNSYPPSRCRRSGCRVRRYPASSRRISTSIRSRSAFGSACSSGTTRGGSPMMRRCPSTTEVSLPIACRLSWVRARACALVHRLRRALSSCTASCGPSSSRSARAYHTSRSRMPANWLIACRYRPTAVRTMSARALRPKPLSRPATDRLAASRLTSHSHGPGWVSSKSLTSNIRRRSGEANAPKFDRCASPHSWVTSPEVGVAARSAAITAAAPRRNVNGDSSMRPCRIGISSGTRVASCAVRTATGSGRSGAVGSSAWLSSGARVRAARPAAARAAGSRRALAGTGGASSWAITWVPPSQQAERAGPADRLVAP